MQKLILFLQKYKHFLFFLLLASISLVLTINNHSFHKSKFTNSANFISGNIHDFTSGISAYTSLKENNASLIDENVYLRNEIEKLNEKLKAHPESQVIDSLKFRQQYSYIQAKIVNHNFNTFHNYLTIDIGKNKDIKKEMAVINDKGILGVTSSVSSQYSTVQSILHKNTRINSRLKNSLYFGTISWDGKDYNTVQLEDIPKQAIVKKGDTIVTDGKSTIFPEGIPIGTVIDFSPINSSILIQVQLFNDMSSLRNAYVIKNFDTEEIKQLENTTNE